MDNTINAARQLSYTVNQAAAQLGIGRTSIYALIKIGELSPIKLLQRTLIVHDDLFALIAKRIAAKS